MRLIISLIIAGPIPPGARLIMPFILVMALMIFSLAIIMPQRLPGRPSFERLMHRTIFGFHSGRASLKIMPGNGTP
ncbi:hypothetical protein D3C86_1990140 [compost metagenome]